MSTISEEKVLGLLTSPALEVSQSRKRKLCKTMLTHSNIFRGLLYILISKLGCFSLKNISTLVKYIQAGSGRQCFFTMVGSCLTIKNLAKFGRIKRSSLLRQGRVKATRCFYSIVSCLKKTENEIMRKKERMSCLNFLLLLLRGMTTKSDWLRGKTRKNGKKRFLKFSSRVLQIWQRD
jgi:hypothetical protein